jgi:small GTP-binding protein
MSNLDKKAIFDDRSQIKSARKIQAIIGDHHPKIAEHIKRIHDLASTPITLTVMGEFSAGKSTFINRLLGIDVLPVSILPKTATITRIIYGATPHIEIEYYHQNEKIIREERGYDGLKRFQNAKKISDDEYKNEIDAISEVRVFVDNPLLKKFNFIDTPGFNHDAAMDAKTMAALSNADLIVWLSDYTQLSKRTEFDVIERLRETNPRIYLIINKTDVHVSCSEAYQQTETDVDRQLRENGFINLFYSEEFYLISCKIELPFWDGMFQQFLSRFGRTVLDADIAISIDLISSQWEKLQKAIYQEQAQHVIMQRNLDQARAILNVQTVIAEHVPTAMSSFDIDIAAIADELINHGKRTAKLCTSIVPAANQLVRELLMMDLYERMTTMEAIYSKRIGDIYIEFSERLCQSLTELTDSLADQHSEDRNMLQLIVAHYDLNRDCVGDVPVMPRATIEAVDLLDEIYSRVLREASRFEIDVRPKLLHALKRDLESDLHDIVLDRSLGLVLKRLDQSLSEAMCRLSESFKLIER